MFTQVIYLPIYKISKSQFGNKFTKKCAKSKQCLTTSEQSWQAKQGSISQSMLSGDSSKYMKSMRKVAANKDNFTLKKIFNKKMWQHHLENDLQQSNEKNFTMKKISTNRCGSHQVPQTTFNKQVVWGRRVAP